MIDFTDIRALPVQAWGLGFRMSGVNGCRTLQRNIHLFSKTCSEFSESGWL